MAVQDLVSWLNAPAVTAVANVATIVALLFAMISLLVYFRHRLQKQASLPQVPISLLAQATAPPKTWWEYLTNDLRLSPKARRACASLYNIGWEQLNRPTNNREETIAEAKSHLQAMRGALSTEEVASAEEVGIALASPSEDCSDDVEARLSGLTLEGQSYARLRAKIRSNEQERASDLALGIPLSDYREVKKALREGIPPAHIMEQLPLAWRMIRTINDPRPRRQALQPPAQPTTIRLRVQTESGLKEDTRAELYEDWVRSEKLDMLLPFTGLGGVYHMVEEGKPLVLHDRMMVYTGYDPPGTESRMWTRGGYVDRMLERTARGEHPTQLRKETRRKRVRFALYSATVAFLAASIVFRLVVELG